MSLLISQECWDHNRRLYREMTESSTPRAHQDKVPLPPTQRTRPIQTTRPCSHTLIHSLPPPIHPTHTVHRSAQAPFDRRPPYPDSRMGRQGARTMRPAVTPITHPFQASTAPAPAPHSNMSGLNLPTSSPQIAYHIRTENSANTYQKPRPAHITQPNLPLILPANNPLLRQVLILATPSLFTVKFGCSCLNRGTCIHYQICFRRDHLPDGLICPTCSAGNISQEIITARRKCPGHVDDSGIESKHVSSRPEDFLPSEEQREGYEEVMGRIASGMGKRMVEAVSETGGREGTAKVVPPRGASRGRSAMATGPAAASLRVGPGLRRGHRNAPEHTMRRASIQAQPDIRQIQTAPMILPPPAWPVTSPFPTPIPTQAPNQTFFHRVSGTSPPPHLFNTNTISPPPQHQPTTTTTAPSQHLLDQAQTEALADDASRTLRNENRRMGIPNPDDNDDEGQGMLYANLRTFETGVPYDAGSALDDFFRNSGLGEP